MRLDSCFGKKHMGTLVSFPKSGRTWLVVMLDQLDVKMVNTHAGSEYVIGCHHYDLPKPKANAGPGKQLFLLRDPRDTVISGYFQKTKRNTSNNYHGSIAQFIRDPRYGIEKIIYFNLTWLKTILRWPIRTIVRLATNNFAPNQWSHCLPFMPL